MSISRIRVSQLPEGSQRKINLDEINESNSFFTPKEQYYIQREKELSGIPNWNASVEEWEDYQWEKHLREKLNKNEDLSRSLGPIGLFQAINRLYKSLFGVCKKRAVTNEAKPKVKLPIKKKKGEEWVLGPMKWFSSVRPISMKKASDTDKPNLNIKFRSNDHSVPHKIIQRSEPLNRQFLPKESKI